ncbi:MAG: hypothetical protein KC417_15230, partial [Myxococcales bacterium]|nr:hypothetical protein [Myxococcales bacterium]
MGWLRWAFVSSVILAVASCTSDERSRFEVVFRPASLAADVSRVELNLIRACADADPLRAPDVRLDTWTLEKGRPFEAPLAIGAGNYAIHARGIDSNCQVRAASCTPIRVRAGGGDTFTITLTQVTTAPACDGGERCENAACVTPDGGIDTDAGDGSAPSNTCQNERQDEDETDIDCGGECEPCDDNSTCDDDSDCASHWCDDGQCADTTACDDHPEALFCDGFETPAITDVWTQALVGVSPVVQD